MQQRNPSKTCDGLHDAHTLVQSSVVREEQRLRHFLQEQTWWMQAPETS